MKWIAKTLKIKFCRKKQNKIVQPYFISFIPVKDLRVIDKDGQVTKFSDEKLK